MGLLFFPLDVTNTTSVPVHQGKYFKWFAMLSFVRLLSTVPLFLNTLQQTEQKHIWAFCRDLEK